MTGKEIVQALRCCTDHSCSAKCPAYQAGLDCREEMHKAVLNLVENLTAENADLRKEVAELREKVPTPRDVIILDEDGREYIDYICPKCKETITQARKDVRTMILATRKYHEECGQPLKWPKPGEKYGSKYMGMPLPEAPEEGEKA